VNVARLLSRGSSAVLSRNRPVLMLRTQLRANVFTKIEMGRKDYAEVGVGPSSWKAGISG
jgi:hypothetical protein